MFKWFTKNKDNGRKVVVNVAENTTTETAIAVSTETIISVLAIERHAYINHTKKIIDKCPRCHATLVNEKLVCMMAVRPDTYTKDETELHIVSAYNSKLCTHCPSVVLALSDFSSLMPISLGEQEGAYSPLGILDVNAMPEEGFKNSELTDLPLAKFISLHDIKGGGQLTSCHKNAKDRRKQKMQKQARKRNKRKHK